MSNPKRRSGGRGGQKKAPASAGPLAKLSQLEDQQRQLVQILTNQSNQINRTREYVDALVELQGKDMVERAIDASKIDALGETMRVAIAEGRVRVADTISDLSIIGGVEKSPEGKPTRPGYIQVGYDQLVPQFKEAALGQGIGFEYKDPEKGWSFLVEKIYDVVKTPPPAEAAPATEQA